MIRARSGTTYRYPTCWRPPGVALAAGGGLLTGMISAELPEVTTTQLILRCRVPPRVAIATSVFTLAIAAAAGASVHALSATPAWSVVAWSIPGVLVGSTAGSRLGRYLPAGVMEKALGGVFAAVGALVIAPPTPGDGLKTRLLQTVGASRGRDRTSSTAQPATAPRIAP